LPEIGFGFGIGLGSEIVCGFHGFCDVCHLPAIENENEI